MADLFNITHDAGNLDEYDSTVTDGGNLSAETPGLAGTAARMEALINDTNAMYGEMGFTETDRLRFRVYLDPNGLSFPDYKNFYMMRWYDSFAVRITVYFGYGSTSRWVSATAATDTGSESTGSINITDDVHWIEFDWKAAATPGADDGFIKLWVDDISGDPDREATGLDNDENGGVDKVRIGVVGSLDTGTSGTFYLDEFKVNNDGSEIGAVVIAVFPPVPGTVHRQRRFPHVRM